MPRRQAKSNSNAGSSMSTHTTASAGAGAGAGAANAGRAGGRKNESIEESVLREVFWLYKDPSKVSSTCGNTGIQAMSKDLGLNFLYPSRKITVMIVGNHSAGKSSFVNWYVGSEVMPTGVAVESQGFTIVTSGERDDTIRGEACVEMKPYLAGIPNKYKGLLEHLEVRSCTSTARAFKNVDFIDTPGLIDGSVGYPFDVNNIILSLAKHVDMILVFLDPITQALCDRTMAVVQSLDNANHGGKMRFLLTKADTVPRPQDLNKVLTQTSASLAKFFKDHHGMSVATMWIPHREASVGSVDPKLNALSDLTTKIAGAVQQKVQSNMNLAKTQCQQLMAEIERQTEDSAKKAAIRSRKFWNGLVITLVLCPLVIVAAFLDLFVGFEDSLPSIIRSAPVVTQFMGSARSIIVGAGTVGAHLGLATIWHRQALFLIIFLVLYTLKSLMAWQSRRLKVLSKQQVIDFRGYKDRLAIMVKQAKNMHSKYLHATQAEEQYK